MSYLVPLQKLLQICFVDQIRVLCYSAWCPVSAGSSKLRLKCQMLLLKRCFSLIHSPQHNVHASHEPLPRWMCQNVCFSLLSVEQIAVVVCHSSECTPTTHWRSFHDIFASSVPNNTFLLILDLTVIWKPTENPFSFYFVMKTIRETWALAKADRRPWEKKKFYHHFSIVKYSYLPKDTFKKICWNACNQEQIDFEVPRLLQALMCV